MRALWPLKALVGVVLLLLLAVAVAAWWLSDTQRTVSAAKALITRVTPYELDIMAPTIHWTPLHVSTPLLLLRYADPNKPPIVSVQDFDLTLPLSQLIGGDIDSGAFGATNISYYLDGTASEEPLDLEQLLSPLSHLPQTIDVESVHLIAGGEQLWVFPLLGLKAERTADGSFKGGTRALVGGRDVALDASARWELTATGSHYLELSGVVAEGDGESSLEVSGRIDSDGPQLSYDFSLAGHYVDVSDFVTAFEEQAFPFEGDLIVNGQLSGDLQGYSLDIDELTLTTADAYSFTATGEVRHVTAGDVTLDLQASGAAQELGTLLPLPEAVTSLVTHSELLLHIGGTLSQPVIEELGVALYGEGDAQLILNAEDQQLSLTDLESLDPQQPLDASFKLRMPSPTLTLASLNIVDEQLSPENFQAIGRIAGNAAELILSIESLSVSLSDLQGAGTGELLWRDETLSAKTLNLALRDPVGGSLSAVGSIADLASLTGVGLQLEAQRLHSQRWIQSLLPPDAAQNQLPPLTLSGTTLFQRPGNLSIARDIDVVVESASGIELRLDGRGRMAPQGAEADISFSLEAAEDADWANDFSVPLGPNSATGQLRLRPAYGTLITDMSRQGSGFQTVVSADLQNNRIRELGVDIYSELVRLDSLVVESASEESEKDTGNSLTALGESLPAFPVHITLRADRVRGPMTDLEDLSFAVDAVDQRLLLQKLDARYAGGDMTLRGVLDLAAEPAALSIAGRGIRIPLGALTRDLNMQESVSGDLSLRGGLSTRGADTEAWLQNLQGGLSLALTDTQISGAAYDLLMSNLMAWLVSGSGEKTTTFDCTMASFEFVDGVARSDDIYVETPRMLASGKARADFPADFLDVRLEPRSKNRTLQFPSAVRVRGKLSDPEVKVSALQATADFSTQALMLLPSLPFKLFGIGQTEDQLLPCETPTL